MQKRAKKKKKKDKKEWPWRPTYIYKRPSQITVDENVVDKTTIHFKKEIKKKNISSFN